MALSGKLPFQFVRVIALTAGPGVFAAHVPATLPIEGILHADEVERRIPVGPLFLDRRRVRNSSDIDGANACPGKPSQPDDLLPLTEAIKDFWLTQNRSTQKSSAGR